MKFCKYCGRSMEDDAETCPFCGQISDSAIRGVTQQEDWQIREEKNFIDSLLKMIKVERIFWTICGFLMPVMGIYLVFIGIIGLGVADGSNVELYSSALTSLIQGTLYIPIGIASLIIAAKLKKYLGDKAYSDIRPVTKRAGSVGWLIVGYLFNNVALIFIIINFVRVKSNKQLIKRICERQQACASTDI